MKPRTIYLVELIILVLENKSIINLLLMIYLLNNGCRIKFVPKVKIDFKSQIKHLLHKKTSYKMEILFFFTII